MAEELTQAQLIEQKLQLTQSWGVMMHEYLKLLGENSPAKAILQGCETKSIESRISGIPLIAVMPPTNANVSFELFNDTISSNNSLRIG